MSWFQLLLPLKFLNGIRRYNICLVLAQKELKKIREKQKADEIKAFRGDEELDGQIEQEPEERVFTRGNSRKEQQPNKNQKQVSEEQSEENEQDEEEEEEEEGSGEEIEDEDDDDSDFWWKSHQ